MAGLGVAELLPGLPVLPAQLGNLQGRCTALCWAWRTAKGGKGIFILDKNDPEVMQSACPNPLFSELRLWRFILSFISADCLFEIGRLLVRSVCLLGRFILAAVDSLKVCVFSSLSHCLTLSLVSD